VDTKVNDNVILAGILVEKINSTNTGLENVAADGKRTTEKQVADDLKNSNNITEAQTHITHLQDALKELKQKVNKQSPPGS
jgi:hypothetical protein